MILFRVVREYLITRTLCVRCSSVAAETAAEATLDEQEAAATKIQALFRGIHDREKVKAMKHEQVSLLLGHSAVCIYALRSTE